MSRDIPIELVSASGAAVPSDTLARPLRDLRISV